MIPILLLLVCVLCMVGTSCVCFVMLTDAGIEGPMRVVAAIGLVASIIVMGSVVIAMVTS